MTAKFAFQILLFALLTFVPLPAMAGNAGLLLSPTRVVFENGNRYITVTVRNNGDATGNYKIELVDATMDENGAIKIREEGKDEFSAIGLLSLSPSSMTLAPEESQVVRLLLKNQSDLPEGEYRSHLQVRMTESDVNGPANAVPTNAAGIAIKTKITTVIPVIIRKGTTSYNVSIDDAKLMTGGGDQKQTPQMKVGMSFSGNRSLLGDIKVTHIAPSGEETQLAFMQGIAIYRGVAKRNQTVELTVPEGVNIHTGKLRVDVLSQQNEGSRVLSEKIIAP